jgi:hypothetical protein
MGQNCTPAARITKSLLGYGVVAGPLYVAVALPQALTRDGFEIDRHAWSLLANGDLGWLQIANFVLTGLMVIAAAVGLRRSLSAARGVGRPGPGQRLSAARGVGGTGPGQRLPGRAAPILIGVYGASLVGAGVFRADPAQGFPVGTPEVTAVSWHGVLHFALGGVGFLCLVAACFVLGRRFARTGRRALAWSSRVTGVVFLAGFAGIASGSHGPTTLAFVAAVMIVCGWLTAVSVHFYRAAA